MATCAAPAINAPPRTPQAHPKAMALRLPNLSLVIPTEALPSHAIGLSARDNGWYCGPGDRTSGLVNRDDGTAKRRVGMVKVRVEGP